MRIIYPHLMKLLLGIIFSFATLAETFPESPNPFRYVNDYTKTLTIAQSEDLENKVIAYSQQTSSQIAIVILPSVGNYPIADYAFELGNRWGIGRSQLDNGILLLIAKEDRELFIATGKGMEGALPDALAAQIIRREILPHFKEGNYYAGISHGLEAIVLATQGEYEALEEATDQFDMLIPIIFFVFFVLIIMLNQSGNLPNNGIGHSRGGTTYRGGYGSGGRRGGGGGFGGGGFGGGGAGGRW